MKEKMMHLIFILLFAINLSAQGKPGVDFTPKLIPIAEGIYAYEGPLHLPGVSEIVRTNSLVIVTNEGVVVADGQATPEESQRMVAEIRKVTNQPIRYLINASPHPDHVNGNGVFKDAVIISHINARPVIKTVPPHVTYSSEMTLHVGGKRIELHYFGPGHTRGDTVVYLPQEKVAFLSELYFNGVFASVSEGYAREHLQTLDRAMKLDATWFIPGHGFIDKQTPEMLKAGMKRYYDNVKTIHDSVERHVRRGDSLEKTLAEIDKDLGEFARLPFYAFLKTDSITGTYNAISKKE